MSDRLAIVSWIAAAPALGAALCFVACARGGPAGFLTADGGPPSLVSDGGDEGPVPRGDACALQCSIDFRSVVRTCDGTVVETCPDNLACANAACVDPCQAAAINESSLGCEFFMQPPSKDNYSDAYEAGSCYAAYVVNTSTSPATLALDLQGMALDLSGAVFQFMPGTATLKPHTGPIAPGDSVAVFVMDPPLLPNGDPEYQTPCPSGVRAAWTTDVVPTLTALGFAFHLTTSTPVSVSTIYPFGGAPTHFPTGTLLLPVATWATEHVVVNAWEMIASSGIQGYPGAQIVAAQDDTHVTIVPTADIGDGQGVVGTGQGIAKTYTLSKGQFLQIVQQVELTGTRVTSDKPTSVFGGHSCMFVPSTQGYCDQAQQELPAFRQWGHQYAAVRYRGRALNPDEPTPYRVVAAFDGTRLSYDPTPPASAPTLLGAGQAATFWTKDPFVVSSQDPDHPFYMAQYMTGGEGDFGGEGDPEFVNVVPAGQYLNEYSFYADPTYPETSLVVIRAKGPNGFADVSLDCAGTLSGFAPIDRADTFEYVRVDLSRAGGPGDPFDGGADGGGSTCTYGLQRMHSGGPFTATLWGWGTYASYAYPGGMAQRALVSVSLGAQ
jgi:hypothetical protein